MTLQECYRAMGGDYEGVRERLRSEQLIQKFTLRFLDDKSYELLKKSLAAGDGEEAFRGAHSMKGVSQNLGFTRLYEASEALTEALRSRAIPVVEQRLVEDVDRVYQETVDAIKEFAASREAPVS